MKTQALIEYDINVWLSGDAVCLTFYPIIYPGEIGHPNIDKDNPLPVMDTTTFYTLEIPLKMRGPRYRKTLAYLENLVNEDYRLMPGIHREPAWDTVNDMDWWSSENTLVGAPALIVDFMSTLPRRGE
jgi:hypothetical protein